MINGIFNNSSYGNIHTLEKIPKDFTISRPNGLNCYTLIHFTVPVLLLNNNDLIKTKPNAFIVYYPYEKQYYKTLTETEHSWIHFDDVSGEICKKCGIKTSVVYYPQNCEKLTAQFYKLQNEMLWSREYYTIMVESYLNELFVCIARSCTINTNTQQKIHIPNEYFNLRKEIINNLQNNWTVSDMASRVGCSVPTFHALYRKYFGISPVNDIIQSRLSKSKHFLISTDLPISYIAEQSGYTNIFHFSRQFKKYTGVSPHEYRSNGGINKSST